MLAHGQPPRAPLSGRCRRNRSEDEARIHFPHASANSCLLEGGLVTIDVFRELDRRLHRLLVGRSTAPRLGARGTRGCGESKKEIIASPTDDPARAAPTTSRRCTGVVRPDAQAGEIWQPGEALRGERKAAIERRVPVGQRVREEGEIRMLEGRAAPVVVVLQAKRTPLRARKAARFSKLSASPAAGSEPRDRRRCRSFPREHLRVAAGSVPF